jgi:hypothetical protein
MLQHMWIHWKTLTLREKTIHLNIFTTWLSTSNELRDPSEIPSMELDKLLVRFFMVQTYNSKIFPEQLCEVHAREM